MNGKKLELMPALVMFVGAVLAIIKMFSMFYYILGAVLVIVGGVVMRIKIKDSKNVSR